MEMLHFIKTCAAWICNACAFLFFLVDSSIVTVRCRLQRNAQVVYISPLSRVMVCVVRGVVGRQ